MFKFITNMWNHPKTTAQGTVEGALLGAIQLGVGDQHTLKVMAGLALWRFVKGLMSADVRKVVDEVVASK